MTMQGMEANPPPAYAAAAVPRATPASHAARPFSGRLFQWLTRHGLQYAPPIKTGTTL